MGGLATQYEDVRDKIEDAQRRLRLLLARPSESAGWLSVEALELMRDVMLVLEQM